MSNSPRNEALSERDTISTIRKYGPRPKTPDIEARLFVQLNGLTSAERR